MAQKRIYTITAPANGSPAFLSVGAFKFFLAKKVSPNIQISFDGNTWFFPALNDALPSNGSAKISARSTTGISASVTFEVANENFTNQVVAVSQANTYLFGNLGVNDSDSATSTLPAADSNGYLQILNGTIYTVSGVNQGNQRQSIVLTTKTNPLQIKTSTTVTGIILPVNTIFPLNTADTLYLNGVTGTAQVTILETYLKTN